MDRFTYKLIFSLLLLSATQAHAESSFVISPSVGGASISNIDGYNSSPVVRVDGSFHLLPQFGFNLFVAGYTGFNSSGSGNDIKIRVTGYGAGITSQWPVHPHMQPYVRVDYMLWNAKSTGLGRTLAEDNGSSAGFAAGIQFPIKNKLGVKAEVSGYNDVSGADIRQLSVGMTVTF